MHAESPPAALLTPAREQEKALLVLKDAMQCATARVSPDCPELDGDYFTGNAGMAASQSSVAKENSMVVFSGFSIKTPKAPNEPA
jgi:hypothetical protein